MLLIAALKNKAIRLLWTGQMLSAIGDEVYRMAFIWIAVGLVGTKAGLLSASQSLVLVLVTLFGGKWADHWNLRNTLVRVDFIRAMIVLIPVFAHYFFPDSLTLLWLTSILIVGLAGFFDPAIQSVLPKYCENTRELQAANGLMSTTMRMARVGAPVLIGLLTTLIPTIHFFTLDSLSYLISMMTIIALFKIPEKRKTAASKPTEKLGIFKSLQLSFQTLKKSPIVFKTLILKCFMGGLWQMGYGIGFALLVKERLSGHLSAYGIVMGAYGIGNISAALYFGNRERHRLVKMINSGFIVLGIGFISLNYCTHLLPLSLAAAFTAIGGPLNDTPFNDLVQSEFEVHDLPKIFRLRTAIETSFGLLSFAISPFLFHHFQVGTVLAALGVIMLLLGLEGYIKHQGAK